MTKQFVLFSQAAHDPGAKTSNTASQSVHSGSAGNPCTRAQRVRANSVFQELGVDQVLEPRSLFCQPKWYDLPRGRPGHSSSCFLIAA